MKWIVFKAGHAQRKSYMSLVTNWNPQLQTQAGKGNERKAKNNTSVSDGAWQTGGTLYSKTGTTNRNIMKPFRALVVNHYSIWTGN